jgi:hypothetical protein
LTEAGIVARNQGDLDYARLLAEECQILADKLGDSLGLSMSRWILDTLAQIDGNNNHADELFTNAVTMAG